MMAHKCSDLQKQVSDAVELKARERDVVKRKFCGFALLVVPYRFKCSVFHLRRDKSQF
ncbi:MAG: hypothetical protein RMK89_01770 [Armatimonadota bacterium]|nr:hypothetical protein [Armatimonadota bacterium]MDW8142168.1 hypothetical protein [Armatimonadota bacterium]